MGFPTSSLYYNLIACFCLVSLCCTPLPAVFAQPPYLLCSRQQYEESSRFAQDLDDIMIGIHSNMEDDGYYTESRGVSPDGVHVAALCRADTLLRDCQSCIGQAVENIRFNCSDSINAFLWQKWCMLRIWSSEISWNEYDSINYPSCFTTAAENSDFPEIPDTQFTNLDTLLDDLAVNASSLGRTNSLMVAAGNFTTGDSVIHSMVQCMPDLSPNDCYNCLSKVIQRRPECAHYNLGTLILTPRCFVQYDTYQFYDSTRLQQVENMDMYYYDTTEAPAPAPAPAPDPSTQTPPPPDWSRSTPRKPFFPPPPPSPTEKESGSEPEPLASASKPGWIIPVAIGVSLGCLGLVGIGAGIFMKIRSRGETVQVPVEPRHSVEPRAAFEPGPAVGDIGADVLSRLTKLKQPQMGDRQGTADEISRGEARIPSRCHA